MSVTPAQVDIGVLQEKTRQGYCYKISQSSTSAKPADNGSEFSSVEKMLNLESNWENFWVLEDAIYASNSFGGWGSGWIAQLVWELQDYSKEPKNEKLS